MNDVAKRKEIMHRGFTYPAQLPLSTSDWNEIGTADLDGDLYYEFNEVRVFQHKLHGGLLIAQDSGCSCPTPFEDAVVDSGRFLNSLVDFDAFVAEHEVTVTVWNEEHTISTQQRSPSVVDQVTRLRQSVEELIGAQPTMIEERPSGLIEG